MTPLLDWSQLMTEIFMVLPLWEVRALAVSFSS